MADLSVLIPARQERFLRETIEDILATRRRATEVIAVLDGAWTDPPIVDHPDVRLLYTGAPIGQRAAVNQAAKLSEARYVMKLDAHCALDPGFDEKLIAAAEALGPDVTQIPAQYNLHGFDWRCGACQTRTYQGPTPTVCGTCQAEGPFTRFMVWKPRGNRRTEFWRFDPDLRFQYWGAYKTRPEAQGDLCDVMTSLGACFFMTRERFWQIGGLDEAHGGWGQLGVEVACKSWLSGGRQVVNKRTWFAHMFRTQGGDFSHPYPLSGSEVEGARTYSRQLWKENRWPGQVRPLAWLLEKFQPVPGWHSGNGTGPAVHVAPRKGLVYYSDCRADPQLLDLSRRQMRHASGDLPIVSVTLQPVDFGTNLVLDRPRGIATMFRQILLGLEHLEADIAFLVEHDCLYHRSHFDFTPPRADVYYYNEHTWKVDVVTGQALFYYTKQTSGLCAHRDLLVEHYRRRLAKMAEQAAEFAARGEAVKHEGFTRRMGFEPGCHPEPRGVDNYAAARWMSPVPNIDLRHADNLTASRWSQSDFRDPQACLGWRLADEVPGWGRTKGRMAEFLEGLV